MPIAERRSIHAEARAPGLGKQSEDKLPPDLRVCPCDPGDNSDTVIRGKRALGVPNEQEALEALGGAVTPPPAGIKLRETSELKERFRCVVLRLGEQLQCPQ